MDATSVITDAMERLNRLYPGETLNADDAAVGFRRLNLLVDELSAKSQFLYKSTITSVAQTGNITLAAGNWAAIPTGTEIVSVTVANLPISKLTMNQYSMVYDRTSTGSPTLWAHDGAATVYLVPVPTGETVELLTRSTATAFADLTTDYTVPPGFENYLGAAMAVRLAPILLGKVPDGLVRAERAAMAGIMKYEPAVLDVYGYGDPYRQGSILDGY